MAKSGLIPEVLGNHYGIDGLKTERLPDIGIHQGEANYQIPNQITARSEISQRSPENHTLHSRLHLQNAD